MSDKRYPEEFKLEAVKQVTERSHSVAEVSARLGVSAHSMYAWLKKYGPDAENHKVRESEQSEIRRLRKELKRAEEERDILKKAAAYFAKQSG